MRRAGFSARALALWLTDKDSAGWYGEERFAPTWDDPSLLASLNRLFLHAERERTGRSRSVHVALHELVLLVRERPEIGTGALIEHFAAREESAALQKLAAQELPGEDAALRAEFLGGIEQLEKQVLQQRIDELQQRVATLDEAEKYELRALLQSRLQP